jgi:hypothetical protein
MSDFMLDGNFKLNTTVPNVARVYDYMLGGKDNFEADRMAADKLIELLPGVAEACRRNRDFLGRVVTYLASQGIRQFIDIGSGLPTGRNVHEIAQDLDPEAHVIYVDRDPMVVIHANVLLADKSQGVVVIQADLRQPPGIIIDHPDVRRLIDFRQPVAVLLFGLLHFITDEEKPWEIVAGFTDVMAPGSYLALSHITDDDVEEETSQAARNVYQGASAPVNPRSRQAIARFFDGLDMVHPGVVNIGYWPEASPDLPVSPSTLIYGGVALKR